MQASPWISNYRHRQDSLWFALAPSIIIARRGAGCLKSAASTDHQCKVCFAGARWGRARGVGDSIADRWVCGRLPVCHPCEMWCTLGTIWRTQICNWSMQTWTVLFFACIFPCLGFSSGELGRNLLGRSYSGLFCQSEYSPDSGHCGQNSCRGGGADSRSASMWAYSKLPNLAGSHDVK